MRVVLSREAQYDLEAIADYIAEHDPARSRSFVRELVAKAKGIGEMPRRFPLWEVRPSAGIRRRVHGNYLIFYRVEVDRIYVIHILHSARDHERLLDRGN